MRFYILGHKFLMSNSQQASLASNLHWQNLALFLILLVLARGTFQLAPSLAFLAILH